MAIERVTWHPERDKLSGGAENFQNRKLPPNPIGENATGILVPMDFSDCALKALHTAVRLAQRSAGSITLLHVIDMSLFPSYRVELTAIERDLLAGAERNLAEIVQSLSASVRCATKIVKGRPYEQILKVTREQGPQLMVMGKRPTPFWTFMHRQTVRRVTEKACCDVIIVPEEDRKPSYRESFAEVRVVYT